MTVLYLEALARRISDDPRYAAFASSAFFPLPPRKHDPEKWGRFSEKTMLEMKNGVVT